jgi:NAD(P)-dependent dehydrogenase (short-subunit alcohol dehydrogenase family)
MKHAVESVPVCLGPGASPSDPGWKIPRGAWDTHFHVLGPTSRFPYAPTRKYTPPVNVSSCYAVIGRSGMGLYDATKAGLLAMTRTLAFEEAAYGVRANAVCPGSTLTDFHIERARRGDKSVDTLKTERGDNSLLARWAAPEEIAWPILWLASHEASFITGTTLMVDGGLHVM